MAFTLKGRESNLLTPSSIAGRVGQRLVDGIEWLIAKQSRVGDRPTFDISEFPWAIEIERNWQQILEELQFVLARRAELPNFQEIASEVETITQDDHWKTFFFYGFSIECEQNRRLCPNTDALLQQIPGLKTAFFSILSPGKKIPPHRGAFNGLLRYHLGLQIPEPRGDCWIRVANEYYHWDEGGSFIFDDTYQHEVHNNTDGYRVVLFVDFVRPTGFPANLINWVVLESAKFTPMLNNAKRRYQQWAKQYHDSNNLMHNDR